jgi:hypothetical protein
MPKKTTVIVKVQGNDESRTLAMTCPTIELGQALQELGELAAEAAPGTQFDVSFEIGTHIVEKKTKLKSKRR